MNFSLLKTNENGGLNRVLSEENNYMKKLTKAEIKRELESDIKELGIYDAFKKLVLGNIGVIVTQFNKSTKSLQKAISLANWAVSLSINSYRDAGLISKLYNVVLYENNENVVHDEIMNYAITETIKLI